MDFNFSDNKFQNLLREKQAEIMKRTAQGIQELPKFKQFHSSLFSFLKNNAFFDFKAILISKEEIEKLPVDYYQTLENALNSDDGVLNNCIILNSSLEIVRKNKDDLLYSDSNSIRKLCTEISKQYVVFLLQPKQQISLFIDGEDFVEGVFLSMKDMKSYISKKSITQISEIFDEYRKRIRERNIYSNFFVSKSHLKSLRRDLKSELCENDFIKEYCHLLENKPEDRLREDLRLFLKERLNANLLAKEYILANFKRLDIFILDESGTELYLIEVKWVGSCVSADGKKISKTSFDEGDINPKAIIQTVDYLKQLAEFENGNIKLGYLVVFDARKDQTRQDTVAVFNEDILDSGQKIHYKKLRKVADFKIANTHPT